jgi:hypothetical protein
MQRSRILVAPQVPFGDSFRKSRDVGCDRITTRWRNSGQSESHLHIGKEGTWNLRTMMVKTGHQPTASETAVDSKGAQIDGLQKSIPTSP